MRQNKSFELMSSLTQEFGWRFSGGRKFGFTLAETLITIGIIGVVAAMTLPSLISNYKEKVIEAQTAKAKATLANGYKLMMARNHIFRIENMPILTECNFMRDMACMSQYHKDAFVIASDSPLLKPETMPKEYTIWSTHTPSLFSWEDVDYMFMTGDGIVYGVILGDNLASFDVVADINGNKAPNVVKKDLFEFRFVGTGNSLHDVSSLLAYQQPQCQPDNPDCMLQAASFALDEFDDLETGVDSEIATEVVTEPALVENPEDETSASFWEQFFEFLRSLVDTIF